MSSNLCVFYFHVMKIILNFYGPVSNTTFEVLFDRA